MDNGLILGGVEHVDRLAATALWALAFTYVVAVQNVTCAQDYPSRPIKLVLPQPLRAGSGHYSRDLDECVDLECYEARQGRWPDRKLWQAARFAVPGLASLRDQTLAEEDQVRFAEYLERTTNARQKKPVFG